MAEKLSTEILRSFCGYKEPLNEIQLAQAHARAALMERRAA